MSGNEADLMQWIVTTGGPVAALALVMLIFMRRDSQRHAEDLAKTKQQHIDDLKEFHDKWKGQSEMLYRVVQETTSAIVELRSAITELKLVITTEAHNRART